MEWLNSVEQVLRKYAQFDGRSRRKEYWYFMLFYYCVVLGFSLLSMVSVWFILLQLFTLAMLIPSLAVTVRRLHDIGRSGAWILIGVVPVFGWVILVIWLCQEGTPGDNMYGPSPLQSPSNNYVPVTPISSRGLAVKCLSGVLRGQTYRIGNAGIVLGRGPSCGIRFPDGAPGISIQHCRIQMQGSRLVLVDMNSRYGTWMENGKKLPPQYPELLNVGSRFYLGSQANMFQIVYM